MKRILAGAVVVLIAAAYLAGLLPHRHPGRSGADDQARAPGGAPVPNGHARRGHGVADPRRPRLDGAAPSGGDRAAGRPRGPRRASSGPAPSAPAGSGLVPFDLIRGRATGAPTGTVRPGPSKARL